MDNQAPPCRVGIVGCGDISNEYIANLRGFPEVAVVACADLDPLRAAACARRWGLAELTVPALLSAADVDLVVNLTPPGAHAGVTRDAMLAGKDVYSEKPLATDLIQARGLLELAGRLGRRLACAPDTFLSPAYAAARAMIQAGELGEPVAISMSGLYEPPERWHPDPRFLYAAGAGPLFDMGPYFLHALFFLAGPVRSVLADARTALPVRRIESGPLAGTDFDASTPTYIDAILQLHSGLRATLQTSFDIAASTQPFFEIQGTAGTLVLPDPENPDGTIRQFRDGSWHAVQPSPVVPHLRGTGLRELVRAAREGRPAGLRADYAVHAVDVMQSILRAADLAAAVPLTTWMDPIGSAEGEPAGPYRRDREVSA